VEVTDEPVTVNTALLVPKGIIIEDGTVAAALLLDKVTACPPAGAAAFKVTVQEEVAAPKRALLAHAIALTAGTPAPLRLITAEGLTEELLEIVNVPAAVPVVTGLKLTVSAAVCPEFSVIGKVMPEIVKPLPDMVVASMASGPVPVEVRVKDWFEVVLTIVLPKVRLLELRLSAGSVATGFAVTVKVVDTPPDVPLIITVWAVVTA
jgi:hypothetical protein